MGKGEKRIRKYLIIGVGIFMLLACDSRAPEFSSLRSGNNPWSPDSRQIVYTFNETDSLDCLFVFDLTKQVEQQITIQPACGGGEYGATTYNPTWSPINDQIAYVVFDNEIFTGTLQNIAVIDSNGKPQHQLAVEDRQINPIWSPDGQEIAFVSYNDTAWNISIFNIKDNQQRQLTQSQNIIGDGTFYSMRLSWSLDSETLAYIWITEQEQAIYTVDVETGKSTKISEGKDSYSNLTWLSNGSLAFLAREKGEYIKPYQLYQIDEDGQNLRLISEINDIDALSVSIDGSHLAFVQNSSTSLYIKDVETGAAQRFDIDRIAYQSYWSPDGKYLLLGSNSVFLIYEIETGKTIYERNAPPATWEQSSSDTEFPFIFYAVVIACLCCGGSLFLYAMLPLFSLLNPRRTEIQATKAPLESFTITATTSIDETAQSHDEAL